MKPHGMKPTTQKSQQRNSSHQPRAHYVGEKSLLIPPPPPPPPSLLSLSAGDLTPPTTCKPIQTDRQTDTTHTHTDGTHSLHDFCSSYIPHIYTHHGKSLCYLI
mmetsp:Transcript_16680/g.47522  ORF Transcript_16680/g.47522 Transcript_16680/m.47522 type:complete len:104 (-) Transcript_16680:1071-1382(-)